jgi:hypothetical protein
MASVVVSPGMERSGGGGGGTSYADGTGLGDGTYGGFGKGYGNGKWFRDRWRSDSLATTQQSRISLTWI